MQLLIWIFIGAVTGWGTGKFLKGDGYGAFMDILMGVGGGVLGGFLSSSLGLTGYARFIFITMAVMIGAAVIALVAAYVNGRRLHARQL